MASNRAAGSALKQASKDQEEENEEVGISKGVGSSDSASPVLKDPKKAKPKKPMEIGRPVRLFISSFLI